MDSQSRRSGCQARLWMVAPAADPEKTQSFQFDLQATWEDRFRLVAYRLQPELVEAVTNTGTRLSGQSTTSGWNIAGPSTRQVSMNLRMQPPATSSTLLKTMRLKWELIAVGDMAQIDSDDLGSKAPHFQDDVEPAIEAVETAPGPRCEVTLRIVSDSVVSDPADLEAEGRLGDCETEKDLLLTLIDCLFETDFKNFTNCPKLGDRARELAELIEILRAAMQDVVERN